MNNAAQYPAAGTKVYPGPSNLVKYPDYPFDEFTITEETGHGWVRMRGFNKEHKSFWIISFKSLDEFIRSIEMGYYTMHPPK